MQACEIWTMPSDVGNPRRPLGRCGHRRRARRAQHSSRMRDFIERHPQGHQGRATYSLQEYGLSAADVHARFAAYEAEYPTGTG